jgi:hypothetical protein
LRITIGRFLSGLDCLPSRQQTQKLFFYRLFAKLQYRNSSEPFRAFLDAILSVHTNVSVQTSVLRADIGCGDDIPENEEDNGSATGDDANVGSGSYVDGDTNPSTISSEIPITCSRTAASRQAGLYAEN